MKRRAKKENDTETLRGRFSRAPRYPRLSPHRRGAPAGAGAHGRAALRGCQKINSHTRLFLFSATNAARAVPTQMAASAAASLATVFGSSPKVLR